MWNVMSDVHKITFLVSAFAVPALLLMISTEHDCKSKNGKNSVPNNGNGNGNGSDVKDVVLKKLGSIGVTIDMAKLRNVK